jgi:hypothetical protein
VTVQVVDEPAVRGITVDPADKRNQIRVAEVMGKRRTEDEVCRSGSARANMLAVSKRMDNSGGVDSAADFVDQGLTSTPVGSSVAAR